KVKIVAKSSYTIFLNRANQLYEMMLVAKQKEYWAALGVNAVHCAIALNDAITVCNLGQRSAGEDHATAAELLYRVNIEGVEAQAKNYSRILAKKTAIEYEERDFRQADALDIFKQVERFYQWGVSKLPYQA
ncbi:MAG: hypothetical protein V2A70_10315, partial [Candidatus Omnitrophota bacterium]